MSTPARVIPLDVSGRARPLADWPLARFVEWWLLHGAVGLAPESRRTYLYVTRPVLEDVGDVPLCDLTAADIQPTITRLIAAGRSPATVYLTKWGVSSALASAMKLGLVERNAAHGVVSPLPELAERTVLSPVEVTRLVAYLADARPWQPVNAVLTVMLLTGTRVHEAVAPRASDLSLGASPTLRVDWQAARDGAGGWLRRKPKTRRSRRTIPLPPEAVTAIERRLAMHPRPPTGDDWALGLTLARPYGKTVVSTHLRAACRLAGVPGITPHECRTAYATNAARAGVDIVLLSTLLGDRPETVMRHYVKTDDDARFAAVTRMFARLRTDAAVNPV